MMYTIRFVMRSVIIFSMIMGSMQLVSANVESALVSNYKGIGWMTPKHQENTKNEHSQLPPIFTANSRTQDTNSFNLNQDSVYSLLHPSKHEYEQGNGIENNRKNQNIDNDIRDTNMNNHDNYNNLLKIYDNDLNKLYKDYVTLKRNLNGGKDDKDDEEVHSSDSIKRNKHNFLKQALNETAFDAYYKQFMKDKRRFDITHNVNTIDANKDNNLQVMDYKNRTKLTNNDESGEENINQERRNNNNKISFEWDTTNIKDLSKHPERNYELSGDSNSNDDRKILDDHTVSENPKTNNINLQETINKVWMTDRRSKPHDDIHSDNNSDDDIDENGVNDNEEDTHFDNNLSQFSGTDTRKYNNNNNNNNNDNNNYNHTALGLEGATNKSTEGEKDIIDFGYDSFVLNGTHAWHKRMHGRTDLVVAGCVVISIGFLLLAATFISRLRHMRKRAIRRRYRKLGSEEERFHLKDSRFSLFAGSSDEETGHGQDSDGV